MVYKLEFGNSMVASDNSFEPIENQSKTMILANLCPYNEIFGFKERPKSTQQPSAAATLLDTMYPNILAFLEYMSVSLSY